MTWAESVKKLFDVLGEDIDSLDAFEKQMLAEYTGRLQKSLNTLSLARIATALEKIAGLPYDKVDENDYLDLEENV